MNGYFRRTAVGRRWTALASAPVLLLAAATSGCHPPHPHAKASPRAISTLDCPESEGDLTRKSVAADGKSCVYGGDDGGQVTLRLVSLDGGDLRAALAPIEAELKTEVPVVTTAEGAKSPGAAARGHDGDKDRVDINLPGIHIHAHGDGGADIDTGGVHVRARDSGGHDHGGAVVQVGDGKGAGVNINADDHGAQIRIDESGAGLRADYILASETAGPHGFRSAAYLARGPAGGPVAVAVLLSKSDDGDDDMRHDVKALLRRNVGA